MIVISFIVNTNASPEIIITYIEKDIAYTTIKRVIENDLQIPTELFRFIQKKKPCEVLNNVILHICIKNKDFEVVQQNIDVLKRSISHLIRDVK